MFSFSSMQVSTCQSYDPKTGPYLVGLTGGIATGKSSIVKHLSALGAFAIDCDKVTCYLFLPRGVIFPVILEMCCFA